MGLLLVSLTLEKMEWTKSVVRKIIILIVFGVDYFLFNNVKIQSTTLIP